MHAAGRVISAPAAVRRMTGVHSAFKVAGHIEPAAGYCGNPTFCGVARTAAWSSLAKIRKGSSPGIGLTATEGDGRSAGWYVRDMPDNPAGQPLIPTPLPAEATPRQNQGKAADVCDICGSDRLVWRNCKLLCTNCRSIVKSCADL